QNPGRTQEDRGGWQRFPSNSDRGSRSDSSSGRGDRGDSGGSKPPLELHRPIVTPRNDSRGDSRNDQRYTPPPARMPDTHNEQPRYTPALRGRRRRTTSSLGTLLLRQGVSRLATRRLPVVEGQSRLATRRLRHILSTVAVPLHPHRMAGRAIEAVI